jgi:hypothetical protein
VDERHLTAGGVETRRRRSESEVDAPVRIPPGRLQQEVLRVGTGDQCLLRQGRPVVGQRGLAGEQDHLSVVAGVAKSLRRPDPGQGGTDHDDRAHRYPLTEMARAGHAFAAARTWDSSAGAG